MSVGDEEGAEMVKDDVAVDSVGFGVDDVTHGLWQSLLRSGMIVLGTDRDGREWGHHGRFVVVSATASDVVLRGECNEWTPVENLHRAVDWFGRYARGYGYRASIAEDRVTLTMSRDVVGPVLST